jgi:hypothetical protein
MGAALNSPQNSKKTGKGKNPNRQMTFLVILVAIQVLISGYMLVQDIIYQSKRSQILSKVSEYTGTLDELTTQMLVDYKVDVYNNANVDTTAKQAVMANEYNFNATMLLVKQNTRLLEVLAQMK